MLEELVVEVENKAAIEHNIHFKKEMDRRAAILAERERLRIEKEERKKRKIEIKRRWAIKAKRSTLREQIHDSVLAKSETFENVFSTPIFEGIPE